MARKSVKTIETPQSRLRVGLARVDITPPIGIYHRMWGAALHDRAESVHRPLLATALWLEPLDSASAALPQVLLALDHGVMEDAELRPLRQAVAEVAGRPLENVSISLSHTH